MLVSANNLDISKIKVIIWDLDNTFWEGIITEGGIKPIHKNMELVKLLSTHGIVNSICSKNYYDECKNKLMELGMWEYFVFPSIEWTPKTNRVLQIVNDMNLRSANALFLDDEPANLQRVLSADAGVMCGTAQELADALTAQISLLREDLSCNRLKQYHELENKNKAREHYDSDEEFLRNAGIKVRLGHDILEKQERIYELINRTNQLNFTKKRLEKSEVDALLRSSEYECAYISCRDNYCDYGIVGFYALKRRENQLEHYLFSCRTIGMGIEQFVYSKLGFPKLTISGEVVTPLNSKSCPDWIELAYDWGESETVKRSGKMILVKGPCDVSQIIPFFENAGMFETEFAYISQEKKGMYIEAFNHSSQVLASLKLSDEEKKMLTETVPFIDMEYYQTSIFNEKYDYIIFSLLSDYSLGLYRNKTNPEIVIPFAQYTRDCTKRENWDYAVSVLMQDGKTNDLLEKQYIEFQKNYEPIGHISDEQLINNLQEIRDRVNTDTIFIFINGAEIPFKRECKPGFENREVLHKHFNQLLKDFVGRNKNCHIINVNDCFEDDDPYLDTIDHYKKIVYFRIAQEIQKFIYVNSGNTDITVSTKSLKKKEKPIFRRIMSTFYHRVRSAIGSLVK